jgi:hypothetical protein
MLIVLAGCSTFSHQWQQPPSTTDLTGPWEGTWRSDVNGHNGKLLGVIQRDDHGRYVAHFRSWYGMIFRFSSSVVLEHERTGDKHVLRGAADLANWAGGRYEYAGTATPTHFTCTYRSRHDQGIFEMKRPHSSRRQSSAGR